MAKYDIWFSFVGEDERHYTTGIGSYPSNEMIDDNNYDHQYALDCAHMFIDGYMDIKRITKEVDKDSIKILISKQ